MKCQRKSPKMCQMSDKIKASISNGTQDIKIPDGMPDRVLAEFKKHLSDRRPHEMSGKISENKSDGTSDAVRIECQMECQKK